MNLLELDNPKRIILENDKSVTLEDYSSKVMGLISEIEVLMGSQPSLNSPEQVHEWLGDFRILWVQLLPYYGKLSQDMLIHQYQFIEELSPEMEKKLKGSSTLLTNLANSKFKHYGLLKQVENLIKVYLQVSPEMNTMLSSHMKQINN